ncbi:helix-turn-helix domain-containing protein [Streptococcus parasanguinis]|uniref:helix-turn-helix domain-containing protein n=1 Tax=Streptococcus parasanguinis TaxID=1318 RepID=UPI0020C85665|nr:XRE family transcriptional regulator [Streptococcus parasanguinis]MCP9067475.1 XRE family transcriptional regulator [Streptococcus parasanguinis]
MAKATRGRSKASESEIIRRKFIADQLKERMLELGFTQLELSKRSGVPQNTLSRYINGISTPKVEYLNNIADILCVGIDFFDVPVEQIDPRLDTTSSIVKNEIAQKIDKVVSKLDPEPYQRNVLTCAERQFEEQKQAKKKLAEVHDIVVEYIAYNYYDQPVSAGTGQYLNEVQIETIQLPVKVDADFVCPIYGDSMEPDYKSGDYVFVKLTVELPSKTVGVFDYEGEAYIKQLIIEKDKAYLRSFNKKYKDIPINSDSDFRIIGKVVDVYREEKERGTNELQ